MSKIDRFLLLENFVSIWNVVVQWIRPWEILYHNVILLKDVVCDLVPKPFMLFNCWMEHLTFKKVVTKVWKQ